MEGGGVPWKGKLESVTSCLFVIQLPQGEYSVFLPHALYHGATLTTDPKGRGQVIMASNLLKSQAFL